MTLSETESMVLRAIKNYGAVTIRRLAKSFGPVSNWHRLVSDGWLRVYDTHYGQVVALTKQSRTYYAELGQPAPYLHGPSAVVDRAYQNDALDVLKQRGYSLAEIIYKRSTGVGKGQKSTDQIVRYVLRAPEPNMAAHQRDSAAQLNYPGPLVPYKPSMRGYPSMYASVSGGGIGVSQARSLYKRHERDIETWQEPLILVVPDDLNLRSLVRRIQIKKDRVGDEVLRNFPYSKVSRFSRVEIVLLPLPKSRQ